MMNCLRKPVGPFVAQISFAIAYLWLLLNWTSGAGPPGVVRGFPLDLWVDDPPQAPSADVAVTRARTTIRPIDRPQSRGRFACFRGRCTPSSPPRLEDDPLRGDPSGGVRDASADMARCNLPTTPPPGARCQSRKPAQSAAKEAAKRSMRADAAEIAQHVSYPQGVCPHVAARMEPQVSGTGAGGSASERKQDDKCGERAQLAERAEVHAHPSPAHISPVGEQGRAQRLCPSRP